MFSKFSQELVISSVMFIGQMPKPMVLFWIYRSTEVVITFVVQMVPALYVKLKRKARL